MVRRRSTVRFRNGAPSTGITCKARSEALWTALILRCGWELLPYWEESGRSPSAALLAALVLPRLIDVAQRQACPRHDDRDDNGPEVDAALAAAVRARLAGCRHSRHDVPGGPAATGLSHVPQPGTADACTASKLIA